jgi:hypothetical protein
MRTGSFRTKREIAVMAQKPVAFREIVTNQPSIKVPTGSESPHFRSLDIPATKLMIDAQCFLRHRSATSALRIAIAIVKQNFLPETLPVFGISAQGSMKNQLLQVIAIVAENLKT